MVEVWVLDKDEIRVVSPNRLATSTNCRLKRLRRQLMDALTMVEEEIDGRLGKGGGGLK